MNIAITGSRDFKPSGIKAIFETLSQHCGKGHTWYVGGARGVDDIVLTYLLEANEWVVVVVPFKVKDQPVACQERIWECNNVVELNYEKDEYWKMAVGYAERNHYMVDRSSLVLAFHNGLKGGTKECVDYANKKGVKTIIIKLKPLTDGKD